MRTKSEYGLAVELKEAKLCSVAIRAPKSLADFLLLGVGAVSAAAILFLGFGAVYEAVEWWKSRDATFVEKESADLFLAEFRTDGALYAVARVGPSPEKPWPHLTVDCDGRRLAEVGSIAEYLPTNGVALKVADGGCHSDFVVTATQAGDVVMAPPPLRKPGEAMIMLSPDETEGVAFSPLGASKIRTSVHGFRTPNRLTAHFSAGYDVTAELDGEWLRRLTVSCRGKTLIDDQAARRLEAPATTMALTVRSKARCDSDLELHMGGVRRRGPSTVVAYRDGQRV